MRPLLALDLSLTSTGVAWRTADGTIDTRVIRTEPGNRNGSRDRRDGSRVFFGAEGYRMHIIAADIDLQVGRLWDSDDVGVSVFAESVPTRGARSIVTLAKLHGHVAHALGFDPVTVDPKTVKKHLTGHGDASKREVLTAVSQRFRDFWLAKPDLWRITEDEVDALAVLAWAIDQEEGE